ncbi:MAG: primosomal protein N' [Nitrospirae bacterium]|nr:primosomal protein N' [Nitrospirota bacterium]
MPGSAAQPQPTRLQVAVVKGPPGLLTYLAPDGELPAPGSRVRVPLGRRGAIGFVVAHGGGAPEGTALKAASAPLDPAPPIGPDMLALTRRVADYYMVPWGPVLAAAMPPMGADGPVAARTVRVARLAIPPQDALALADDLEGRAPRQAQALRDLAAALELPCAELPQGVVPRLIERGLVVVTARQAARSPLADMERNAPARAPVEHLSPPQQAALDAVAGAFGRFVPFLLHGVTGSGKTEVYLRLAQRAMEGGGQALILTPEIALASHLTMAARERFGRAVVVLHSGLSDGERRDEWERARHDPAVGLVIGTRSAVFAPLPRLRLIVVDEEHDGAYKQEESPRYHGRDVALMRAQGLDVPVLLGSATPSLESYDHAKNGRYGYLILPERVRASALPQVRLVDLREEKSVKKGGVITVPLLEALQNTLAAGEQALLFLNRRGFAPSILCRSCGHTFRCGHCAVSLTFHRASRRLQCHYCDARLPVPDACPECGNRLLETLGLGTEGLVAELAELLPDARVARMDRDTTRTKNAHLNILGDMAARRVDILVGTQMIAKGHDLPGITLVGVVCADQGIHVPDFRAAENAFSLLTQVAGRAGRAEAPGRVVLQAFDPDNAAIRHALEHDYAGFAAGELQMREALGFPPRGRVVRLLLRDRDGARLKAAEADLAALAQHLPPDVEVLGPAPPPLAMLRGELRSHMLLKGRKVGPLRQAARWLLDNAPTKPNLKRVRLDVDVDPQTML